jgi:hypothetical protein
MTWTAPCVLSCAKESPSHPLPLDDDHPNPRLTHQSTPTPIHAQQRAAAALRESSAAVQAARAAHPFAPTWTGRVGSAGSHRHNQPPPRFGPRASGTVAAASAAAAGAAGAAGNGVVGGGAAAAAAASSADILARFRDRDGGNGHASSNGGGGNGGVGGGADARFVSLLDKIRKFLQERGGRASTEAVLHHFSWVPNADAVVFKQLLKRAATFEKAGHSWTLREEEDGDGGGGN